MRPDEVKGFAGDVFPNFEEERKRRRQAPPRGKYRPGVSAEGLEKRVLLRRHRR